MQNYLIVCNWKMFFTYKQTIDFLQNNDLASLGKNIVICPSFENLIDAKQLLADSAVQLGAQDCSTHQSGGFTGQVSAASLKEIGCSYCIVGHSESRQLCQYSNDELAKKIEQLFNADITPIYCFGETAQEREVGDTLKVIAQQLEPALHAIKKHDKSIVLAYEPLWAIGTGKTANNEQLIPVYAYLLKTISPKQVTLLYGGSVTASTIKMLKNIPGISGFLLGKASTNFQELKNIVLSI